MILILHYLLVMIPSLLYNGIFIACLVKYSSPMTAGHPSSFHCVMRMDYPQCCSNDGLQLCALISWRWVLNLLYTSILRLAIIVYFDLLLPVFRYFSELSCQVQQQLILLSVYCCFCPPITTVSLMSLVVLPHSLDSMSMARLSLPLSLSLRSASLAAWWMKKTPPWYTRVSAKWRKSSA